MSLSGLVSEGSRLPGLRPEDGRDLPYGGVASPSRDARRGYLSRLVVGKIVTPCVNTAADSDADPNRIRRLLPGGHLWLIGAHQGCWSMSSVFSLIMKELSSMMMWVGWWGCAPQYDARRRRDDQKSDCGDENGKPVAVGL